ncbi:MAG: glutaredoxin [Aquificaceae bacterium]|nr:MAG: glutaredoxin [Aquificaceae bacterium]
MQLLNEEVKNQIREIFNKEVPNPVKVVLFTRAFGCETCEYAERLLKEIEETVPEKFKAEVVSSAIPEGQEKAKEYGLDPDRVPAIVILDKDGKDRGIHYIGLPAGLEFSTFINGIALASKGEVELDEKGKEIVEQIKQPLDVRVFVTTSCGYCPQAAITAYQFAIASPNVVANVYDAQENPDLSQKYQVVGVPKIVITKQGSDEPVVEFVGAQPPEFFLSYLVQASQKLEQGGGSGLIITP